MIVLRMVEWRGEVSGRGAAGEEVCALCCTALRSQ